MSRFQDSIDKFMSEAELQALEYFEAASKIAHRIPEVKQAIDLVVATFTRWTHRGWENASTGASHAALRWFMAWNNSGRDGGLARFENGLKTAMRWSALRVKPGTVKFVQGVELDGSVHFDKRRGPFMCPAAEAKEIVRKLNLEAKLDASSYRYAVTSAARGSRSHVPGYAAKLGMRRIKRYEIEMVQHQQMVSIDWDGGDGMTGLDMVNAMRRADGSSVAHWDRAA